MDTRKVGGYDNKKMLQEITLQNKLGSGASSTVYQSHGLNHEGLSNSTPIAVKVYKPFPDNIDDFLMEIKVLTMLDKHYEKTMKPVPSKSNKSKSKKSKNSKSIICRDGHPNIIKWYSSWVFLDVSTINDIVISMIYPCMAFRLYTGILSKILKHRYHNKQASPSNELIHKIMRDVLSGLAFMHSKRIIHADIKPANIFWSSNQSNLVGNTLTDNQLLQGTFVLADFESSIILEDDEKYHDGDYNRGTLYHNAPELIIDIPYSTSIDIWSLMTVCFEVKTYDILFDIDEQCEVYYSQDDFDHKSHSSLEDKSHQSTDKSTDTSMDGGESEESSYISTESNSEDMNETKHRLIDLYEVLLNTLPINLVQASSWFSNNLNSHNEDQTDDVPNLVDIDVSNNIDASSIAQQDIVKDDKQDIVNHTDIVKRDKKYEYLGLQKFIELNYKNKFNASDIKKMTDFMLRGLQYNSDERSTAKQLLDTLHNYF
jgi:serine/threonine protein kinase